MKNLSNLYFELVNKDLVLKVLRPGDVTDRYVQWLNDPSINKYLEVRYSTPLEIKDVVKFVDSINQSTDTLLFGIYYKEIHVGNIKIGPIHNIHKTTYIGYFIGDKDSWGKGIATAAINMCCGFAFNELGLVKINAGVMEGNDASEKVLKKCDFVLEGNISKMLLDVDLNENVSQKIFGKTFSAKEKLSDR